MYKSIVLAADKDLINTLCECVLNCLIGNVKLADTEKQQLSRYKKYLRKLIDKKKFSNRKRKQILVQKGSGFLPLILSSVLSLFS
jgi:hypothetical protein